MLLPRRLLALELQRQNSWKEYLHYQKSLCKFENNVLRIKFLEKCKHSGIIPKFLKFRIPNNGCFDEKSVQQFQQRLLNKELIRSKEDQPRLLSKLETDRLSLKLVPPEKCMPSIALHTRQEQRRFRKEISMKHAKKLSNLSKEQEKPLFNIKNTVILHEVDVTIPTYVLETLSLGPKNAILEHFDPKDILVELDKLLNHCRKIGSSEETITDINIKTLAYIKECKKLKNSRNLKCTQKFLKENGLLAIPFDKGVGICVMTKQSYFHKMEDILGLSQFQKVIKKRKNEMHPLLKEENRIIQSLKNLRDEGKLSEELYEKLKPRGSQPARLYGLAKVHKENTPVRPVLSMPGSSYHKIGKQIAEWLSSVPECNINSSSKTVCDLIRTTQLELGEEVVSFDVSSLYTNVPVNEAIQVCADLLYDVHKILPPVDKETFMELAKLSSCDVLMLTHEGYYTQIDGLAMGSPPAPHFANGWLSQYDPVIRGNAKLYTRYMDDILCEMKTEEISPKMVRINSLHPSLKFTVEREADGRIPFLDLQITNHNGQLSSTWYSKPTDTGLIMNYHASAPKRYKRSVVSGFVHRIYRACSGWDQFHSSLEKAKAILECNQYPPAFYDPIIKETLNDILSPTTLEGYDNSDTGKSTTQPANKIMLFIQYRGKSTEKYARSLHKCNAPATVVMTLRKLKTVLPSLKPPVEKMLKSGIVYQIQCGCCQALYVGQTSRHLQSRFREHVNNTGPVKKHFKNCQSTITEADVKIIGSTSRGEEHLLTLEALWIDEVKPSINTKDEYRRRSLTIKL